MNLFIGSFYRLYHEGVSSTDANLTFYEYEEESFQHWRSNHSKVLGRHMWI